MRKLALASALLLAFAVPALAGPKDKGQNTLIATDSVAGNAVVNNATTATKVKSKGCTVQVQLKGLTGVADDDILICIAEADVKAAALPASGAGNGVVLLGEAKNGQVKIKGDLSDIGCGGVEAINYNSDLKCYLDDSAYRGGGWMTACSGAGMIPLANPNSEAKTLKHDGEPFVLGLCQGTAPGQRIGAPSSTLIAQEGARTAVQ